VADALEGGGYTVEHGCYGLDTAVSAVAGSGPLHLTICAEYDSLPGIGHACGHNVIAAAAVGAALALAPLADDLGLTVEVLGTPAEEGGGGKILMLQNGAFAGAHAAMMVHPSPTEADRMHCLAVSHLKVHFHGRSAHASAFPHLGRNAADAITVTQTAIGLLRQHLEPGDQVHGIVTHGGDAPNIVPDLTSGVWYVRAPDLARLAEVEPRILRCFEAGALATGCTVDVRPECPPYSEMATDEAMAALYRANAERLGRTFADQDRMGGGSTDMANVSLVVPTIHPMLGLDCYPVVNHQAEFAAACATPVADQAAVDGAVAMAWTAIDLATDEVQRRRLMARHSTPER
jgi:amidohydrolase